METPSLKLEEARTHVAAGRYQAALGALSRTVHLAWNEQDVGSLEQGVSLAGEIARKQPNAPNAAQQIVYEASGYIRRRRPEPPKSSLICLRALQGAF